MSDELFYRITVTAGAASPASYDLVDELVSMTVEEQAQRPAQLTVLLGDKYKVLSHALQEGMQIEADLGTVDRHAVVFRGRIYKIEGSFPKQGEPTLRLIAHDQLMAMGLKARNRKWSDTSLSAIVQEVAQPYMFSGVDVESGSATLKFRGNGIRQHEETDLAFLLRLAQTYGFELYVTPELFGQTLHFKSQYSIMNADVPVTLYYGRIGVSDGLETFQASTDTGSIRLPRMFTGMDYDQGQPIEMESGEIRAVSNTTDRFLDENLVVFRQQKPLQAAQLQLLLGAAPAVQQALRAELGKVDRQIMPGFTTAEELKFVANNQFSTSLHGMRANGTTKGNPSLRAQNPVAIEDVGGRFSGKWYLAQVRHTLDHNGFVTGVECQR